MTIRAASPMDRSRDDHRAIAGAVAGADAGKTGRALPTVPPAAEVPRCARHALGPGASSDRQTNYCPRARAARPKHGWCWRRDKKPHLRGPEAGTTRDDLRQALANGTVADHLAGFTPKAGDAVFIQAGTVHSLGDVVVFEVQQNSDVTFRLYDWDHVDARTGQPRPLQVDAGDGLHRFCARRDRSGDARGGERRRRCCESGSFIVNISRCGGSAGNRRSQWAPQERRGCWCASPARGRWSTTAPIMPSVKATSCSCRRWSARVLPAARCRQPCWKIALPEEDLISMKKLIVFDLDGTLAESNRPSMPRWRSCSALSRNREGGRHLRRRLAAIREASALQSSRMTNA